MLNIIYSIVLSLTLVGCNSSPKDLNNKSNTNLELIDSCYFDLKGRDFQFNDIGYFVYANIEYLYFTDPIVKKIYVFDYLKATLEFEINLPQKNHHITGSHFLSFDTILVQDTKINRILFVNNQGIAFDSLEVPLIQQKPLPNIKNTNPVFFNPPFIYLTGYSGGEYKREKKGDRSVIIRYDIENKKIRYIGDYPEIYYKNNYGGLHYRRVFNCETSSENLYLLSFPASDNIYALDVENGEMQAYIAESKMLSTLKPFSTNNEWYGALGKQDYTKYYYSNPSYGGIIYDKYRGLYYRIAEIPNMKFKYDDLETFHKDVSIIILNERFEYIGETKLDIKTMTNKFFVSKNGLNVYTIPTKKNIAKFYIYKPIADEEN